MTPIPALYGDHGSPPAPHEYWTLDAPFTAIAGHKVSFIEFGVGVQK